MKSFRKVCRGEKGFTLIELLVVIMILGVLAAVVTLAVTRFIGKGTVESANAELVTVQEAIEACLADSNSGSFTAASIAAGPWNGDNATAPKTATHSCYEYMRTHTLKATYTVGTTGDVTLGTDVTWGGIAWDAATGKWKAA